MEFAEARRPHAPAKLLAADERRFAQIKQETDGQLNRFQIRLIRVHPRLVMARVPGVGLLNRTCKSWVERHEVQLLRGLPKSFCGVAQAGKSIRLINERVRVRIPPPRPFSSGL